MPMIDSNGANFFYELQGDGQPIVLIAGYTCDHAYWDMIASRLSKYFQVLIFDNRGVGQTKDDDTSLSAELMAADVVSLIEKLNLEKPHIVGQSMGGTIAQVIASQYSDKINKLCVLSSSSKWRKAMLLGLKSLLAMRERNIDFDFIFQSTLPWIFGEAFLKEEKNVTQFKKIILANPYPQSLKDQIRQFSVLEKFDGTHYIRNIKVPTLVAYGTQDIITLPNESEHIANQIAGSELIEFNCGHGFGVEIPDQLAEALLNFLKR